MTNRIIIFIINNYIKLIKGDEEEEYTASDQQRWLLRVWDGYPDTIRAGRRPWQRRVEGSF
ncbi:hypothetical protein CBFG_05279 [Clostridiales bacterium 1_7_47FAA]|nr:hypothetical protein CBFG_05279 [Clostridiales bacterium 1_7_47FAA]